MIQAGNIGHSNQAAAAAAAIHYAHIPQLTSQMQSLQLAHPGAAVGGYLPPGHQWSALWSHPLIQPPQQSMRMAAPLQPPSISQQQSQQQSPEPNQVQQQQQQPLQHQPRFQQQQLPANGDNKNQVSLPMPL